MTSGRNSSKAGELSIGATDGIASKISSGDLHGELDGYHAQKIFMMLGTNNLDINTDEEIVRGIRETVCLIAGKQPGAALCRQDSAAPDRKTDSVR